MTDARYHYYEPSQGHGLPHDPFNSIVGPRPVGWISTRGSNGMLNLAPYSFFNAFNYHPPIIGFSSIDAKDSLRNVQETREFVWNLTTRDLAEKMNATCAMVPYEVDEFEVVGLTPAPSRQVAVPRVAESGVNFECKLADVIQLRNHKGTPITTWLVLGEVVAVHIRQDLLKDGTFDTFGAGIILRAGGPSAYALVAPESRFDIGRPPGVNHPAAR
ncbi:flavin reductase family protein [Paraburkholderia sp. EG287A]|uniref:flavin reductase family protein n=1 Tax=unclassified Paraburkholderia TaxID=2615204 RepID=UPI0034D2FCB0